MSGSCRSGFIRCSVFVYHGNACQFGHAARIEYALIADLCAPNCLRGPCSASGPDSAVMHVQRTRRREIALMGSRRTKVRFSSACSRPAAPTSNSSAAIWKPAAAPGATITRRPCTVAGFYRHAVKEELLDHSPAAHVRRSGRKTRRPPAHPDSRTGLFALADGKPAARTSRPGRPRRLQDVGGSRR